MAYSGLVLIESRTSKATLRLRLTEEEIYLVERWNLKDQSWYTTLMHTDYERVLHEFLDELCRFAESARRQKLNSDEKSQQKPGG